MLYTAPVLRLDRRPCSPDPGMRAVGDLGIGTRLLANRSDSQYIYVAWVGSVVRALHDVYGIFAFASYPAGRVYAGELATQCDSWWYFHDFKFVELVSYGTLVTVLRRQSDQKFHSHRIRSITSR